MISSKDDCVTTRSHAEGKMGSTCLFCGIFEYPRGSPLASEVLTLLSKNTCEPIWPQTFFPPPPKSPKYPNKTRRAISKFLVEILTELLTPRRATSHILSLEAPYPSRSRSSTLFPNSGHQRSASQSRGSLVPSSQGLKMCYTLV